MIIKKTPRKFYLTAHAREKINYYRLTLPRLKRIFRHPDRLEEGLAERTIAAMQRAGSARHPYEIWIMYQTDNDHIRLISAWRYPGRSKINERPPVPANILEELKKMNIQR